MVLEQLCPRFLIAQNARLAGGCLSLLQLVVDWLEQNAHDSLQDLYDSVEFFTDKMGAW